MKFVIPLGACAALLLLSGGSGCADEALKSGLQPGQRTTPFHPLNVTGAAAGQKLCQV
jgi:hypothetical protein